MPRAIEIVRKFFPEVTAVEDAGRDVIVEVTKRDESIANKKSHKTCAMAVACKRKFQADGIIISVNRAYVIKGSTAKRYTLSNAVSREVVSFDRGGGFAPGEYKLDKPEASVKLGSDRKGSSNGKRHPHTGATKKFIHKTEGIRTALGSKAAVE